MKSSPLLRRPHVLTPALALAVSLLGCGGANPDGDVVVTSDELLVPACTGPAIPAAVASGGDVVLSCGPQPVTINVPPTTVTRPTRLLSLRSQFGHALSSGESVLGGTECLARD